MPRFQSLPALLMAIVALAAGCSDGSGHGPGSPTLPPTRAPTQVPPFGPAPALGGNVISLAPAHGSTVTRESTRSPNPQRPQLPCFVADFTGLPEQGQWFRVTVDGAEVTTLLTWVVSTSGGSPRGCYATPEGLPPGRHTLVVTVRDPRNPAAQPRQTVSWSFDVTP